GGFSGRVVAEYDADKACEEQADEDDLQVQRHLEHAGQVDGDDEQQRDGDADEAADEGEQGGFGEELAHDVFGARADGHAQADFAGAFGDGDQHDVHDADAADDKGDEADCAEQRGHGAGGGGAQGHHLGEVADAYGGVRPCGLALALAHEGFDLAVHGGHDFLRGGFDEDGVHFSGDAVSAAHEAGLGGFQRHDEHVVFIALAAAAALGGEHADHLHGRAVDADGGPQRAAAREQFLPHGIADQHHLGGAAFFQRAELAAFRHGPVARDEVIIIGA